MRVSTTPAGRGSRACLMQTLDDGKMHVQIREDVEIPARVAVLEVAAQMIWHNPLTRRWVVVPASEDGRPPLAMIPLAVSTHLQFDPPEADPPETLYVSRWLRAGRAAGSRR